MGSLHIAQEHPSLYVDPVALEARVRNVLARESCSLDYLCIILTDRSTLRALNREFRGGDYDTDVLSFPLGKDEAVDGEVYVSLDYAAAHCASFGATFEQEAQRYVIHGLLHLIGYDDTNEAGRQRMRRQEDAYLGVS